MKLYRATAAITGRLALLLTNYELTMTQFNVLETLLHLGEMRQRELGGKVMKSGGNITLVLSNLEKMGLVERVRAEGTRRDLSVSLTVEGRKRILAAFPVFAQAVAEQFGVLTAEELDSLGEMCKRVGLSGRRPDAVDA